MSKVFMQFVSGLGPMSRSLPIAIELLKSNHTIKYLGFPNSTKYMSDIGIQVIDPEYTLNDIPKLTPIPNYVSTEEFWETIGYRNTSILSDKINILQKKIQEFQPDLIISDLGFVSSIIARSLQIPVIGITQSCYHPNMAFEKIRWWEKNQQSNKECSLLKWVNNYLEKHNAKKMNKFEEIFTGEVTVIPSYRELDPIINDEFNTIHTGPALFDPFYNESQFSKYFSKSKINIFCYTGRLFDNAGISGEYILREILRCSKLMDYRFIISCGNSIDLNKALQIIKNDHLSYGDVEFVDFIPMNIAYRKSNLVIHHGGHGSCLGQIKYEIPSLIIATHTEREYNARIFHKQGFSEFITRNQINDKNIYNGIKTLLSSKSYKDNIRAYHDFVKEDKKYSLNCLIENISTKYLK